ncbi:MAG: hypothetical protein ABIN91_15850 [Mucilaginibacter sp.]|uniref:hypothetical protein n=1 Tax=Mucilaginibacter sp. TaxID=1882438 RepID=UPI003267FA33
MKNYWFALPGLLLCILLFSFTSKHGQKIVNINGEKIFLKHADDALAAIEQGALKLSIKGVAIVVFIPGDSTRSWVSKMKVVGLMKKGSSNLLGVASTKAAEMADTYQDSGSGIRPPLKGEYGYKGGLIRKVGSGYIIAVFSGGSPDQDKEAANNGAELFSIYFK